MAVTGTFIGDFSSFQAAVEGSTIKIRQLETDSAKVSASLDRVANSFSGRRIIQEATLMAQAIEKGGGASRLTANELERAGRVAEEAAAKMRALGIAVPANIDKLAQSSKSAGGFINTLGAGFASTAAGMVTATAIIGGVTKAFDTMTEFVSSSVEAYAESEAAAKKLTVALENQGNASPEVVAVFKEIAAETQRLTAFEDDAVIAAQAMLVQIGDVQPKEMKKATQATADLAAALGIDLESAVTMVAKAAEGNVTSLGKVGVQLDKAKVEAEGMNYIFEKLEERFGGQAQAQLETYAGKVAQLKNNWGDLKEVVGQSVVEDENLIAAMDLLKESITGVSGAAEIGTPSITAFLAGLASPQARVFIEFLNEANRQSRELGIEIGKIKPPPPGVFGGFTAEIDAADAAAKKLVQDTVAGWEYEEKTREAMEKKRAKETEERNKKFMDEQALFDKLVAESNLLRIEQGGTLREIEIARIREIEKAEIESITRRGQANTANIALIQENASRAIKGLGIDWKMLAEQSIETARQQRDDALETYQYMLAHANEFTREALDRQLQKYRDLAVAATASGRAAVEAQDAATAATKKHNDELDRQKEKEEAAAAAAQKNTSFSTDITAANYDLYQPPSGISKNDMTNLLKQGFSIENALAVLQAQKRGAAVDLSKWPESDRGPRVPGFRLGVERFSGGPAIVGEDGPELVDLPPGASVKPLSRAGGRSFIEPSSVPAIVNVTVSGVFDPNSRRSIEYVVSKELAGRVFGGRR